MDREEVLKKLEELEGEKLRDYHPEVHELIVDFFFEQFDLAEGKDSG